MPGYDDMFAPLIAKFDLDDIVFLRPAIDYHEAIKEMYLADGLLILQGRTSNPAIPAKLYEYLRVRKPILALVDSGGETAGILSTLGIGVQAPLDDPLLIVDGIREYVTGIEEQSFPTLAPAIIQEYSRDNRALDLKRLFQELVSG